MCIIKGEEIMREKGARMEEGLYAVEVRHVEDPLLHVVGDELAAEVLRRAIHGQQLITFNGANKKILRGLSVSLMSRALAAKRVFSRVVGLSGP